MCKVIYNNKYNLYNLGPGHPFDPVRVEMVLDLFKELGISIDITTPGPATVEDISEIHDSEYVKAIEAISAGKYSDDPEKYGLGTADNPIVKGMAEGARYQCGGTLSGAKLILRDKTKKVLQLGGGFHHAHKNFASGFCIYNDLALAINEFTKAGLHVAYIDIDVHHGDGVQEIFYSDDKVMTISLHESGEYLFPGTGWMHELGKGTGRSLKVNVPLEPFTEGESYLEVIDGIVEPALKWFKPDIMILQAGADAHFSDPLADLNLTTYDFEKIFRKMINLANNNCNGKMLITLGGGYSINATPRIWTLLYSTLINKEIHGKLPQNWILKWEKKLNKKLPGFLHDVLPAFDKIPRKNEIENHNRDTVRRLNDLVSPHWL